MRKGTPTFKKIKRQRAEANRQALAKFFKEYKAIKADLPSTVVANDNPVRKKKNAFKRMKGWLGLGTKPLPKAANDNKPWSCVDTYIQRLEKRGYERLGGGVFGTVYAKKGRDRVLKVCRSPDAWLDYIKWASEEGYTGTFAPKVYGYKPYIKGGFGVASMERLDKTMHKVEWKEDAKFVKSALSYAQEGNKKALELCEAYQPGLVNFYKTVKSKACEFGYDDFHDGNIMVRSNGQIVVCDPCSGASDLAWTRMKLINDKLALVA